MRAQLLKLGFVLIFIFLACPALAWAQRVPHEGGNAVGGDVGIYFPQQDELTTGPALTGFLEHYLTARDSVRGVFGWANPHFDTEDTDSLRQVRIGGDLLHNWEHGTVHPFVGAGLAAYFLQARDNGHDVGDSRTRFGGNVLAGVEYFTSNTFAVKGEAAYHIVSKIDQFNPSGLLLTVGGKVYF